MPIVILRLEREEDASDGATAFARAPYLSSKGLKFDLVVLNDHPSGYAVAHESLQTAGANRRVQTLLDKPGGVFFVAQIRLRRKNASCARRWRGW